MTAILSSAHLLKFRSSRGYLPTVTSLVCADTLTSLMLGIDKNTPKVFYFQIIIWSTAINEIESWLDIKFSYSYTLMLHRLYNPLKFQTQIICSNKIHRLSKVYKIGFQRYRDKKIRVCGKDPIIVFLFLIEFVDNNSRSSVVLWKLFTCCYEYNPPAMLDAPLR